MNVQYSVTNQFMYLTDNMIVEFTTKGCGLQIAA